MIVVDELKLNKFREVSIPKNKDLFSRIGSRSVPVIDGQVANFSNPSLMPDDMLEDFLSDKQMPADLDV